MRDCHKWASRVSNSDTSTQYRLDCLLAKLDWQISGAGSVITRLKTYADNSPVHLNLNQMAAKAAALPGISHVGVSYSDTAIQSRHDILYCQICSAWSIETRLMAYGQDSPVRLKVVELCMVHSFDDDMCTWPQVSGAPQNRYWRMNRSPSLHHSQNSTQAIYPKIGQPGNL